MRPNHLRRREFITLLGSAAAVWPLATTGPGVAQQPTKIAQVGILTPSATDATPAFQAFRKGIRDLGYVEGQTIMLDFRFARGNFDALPSLAAELVRAPVDLIVTDSTSGTVAAFGATRTIPIVMATTGGDPVALGVAKSIARPGGNVTGMLLRSFELSGRRLQLLKDAAPAIGRVAVLINPKSAIGPPAQRVTEDAAKLLRVAITPVEVSNLDELRALEPAVLTGSDGLTVVNDAMFWNNRATILALASAARIPAIYPEREYADDGGLIAYGANVPDHFHRVTFRLYRVSRVKPVQTAMRNCTRDEGRFFEAGSQVQASNRCKVPRRSHACNPHGAIIALQHPDIALVWLGSKRESASLGLMSALASCGHNRANSLDAPKPRRKLVTSVALTDTSLALSPGLASGLFFIRTQHKSKSPGGLGEQLDQGSESAAFGLGGQGGSGPVDA